MITPQQLADDKQNNTPSEVASFLDQATDIFIANKTEQERMDFFNACNQVGIFFNYEIDAVVGCKRNKAPKPH